MTRRATRAKLFLRCFFTHGSWNYRTLLGPGTAWALLSASERGTPSGREHVLFMMNPEEPFNSHPYLTPLAVGAIARAVSAGTPPDRVRAFREALRSPLGSLGDQLVWSAWRPLCLLGAMLAVVLGAPPAIVVGGTLLIYNGLHLFLRAWALRAGWTWGLDVAQALERARLTRKSKRLAALGVLVLGVLAGLMLASALRGEDLGFLWASAGSIFFLAGFWGGDGTRRGIPFLVLAFVLIGLVLP